MRWEWEVKLRLWKILLLRRYDDSMSSNSKRWAIGLVQKYVGMDGKTYPSACLWKELG